MAFLEMLQHIATHHVINFRRQKQTNKFPCQAQHLS